MNKEEATALLADFQSTPKRQEAMADWINYFGKLCAANALARGFHEDEQAIREVLNEAAVILANGSLDDAVWFDSAILQAELARQASEIGEAVEAVRKPGPDHHCPDFSNFLIEEADVLIRVGDTCLKRELPLGEATVAKLLYNLSRPFKHGKNS